MFAGADDRASPETVLEALCIVVADGSPIVRGGLRAGLEEAGMRVVADVADADAAVDAAIACEPHAVLLAADLPGGAISAIARIHARLADTEFVVVAEHADPELMLQMVRAGARGFLPAEADPARLPHAVAGVVAGETAFPRRLVRAMADELAREERRRRRSADATLTAREADVLSALADGDTPVEVARRLQISEATVRRHVANAMRKLDVPDRAAAIAALRPGV